MRAAISVMTMLPLVFSGMTGNVSPQKLITSASTLRGAALSGGAWPRPSRIQGAVSPVGVSHVLDVCGSRVHEAHEFRDGESLLRNRRARLIACLALSCQNASSPRWLAVAVAFKASTTCMRHSVKAPTPFTLPRHFICQEIESLISSKRMRDFELRAFHALNGAQRHLCHFAELFLGPAKKAAPGSQMPAINEDQCMTLP